MWTLLIDAIHAPRTLAGLVLGFGAAALLGWLGLPAGVWIAAVFAGACAGIALDFRASYRRAAVPESRQRGRTDRVRGSAPRTP